MQRAIAVRPSYEHTLVDLPVFPAPQVGEPSTLVGAAGALRQELVNKVVADGRAIIDDRGRGHGLFAQLATAISQWRAVLRIGRMLRAIPPGAPAEAAGAGTLDAATLRADFSADRWLAWVEPLLTRKRQRFGDDVRLVGHWHVRRHRGQLDIQMETRVSPALHTQLEAAGMR